MSYDHIRSWYELEEITERQERMITIYEKEIKQLEQVKAELKDCLLYTSPSPRDRTRSRMPSSA